MNKRDVELLLILSDGQSHQIMELASILTVSSRLVRYALEKINQYLNSIGLPSVSSDRKEGVQLLLGEDEKNILLESLSQLDNISYFLTAEERQAYILISMWCTNECLTSQYFADELNVSKSSIDKDIQTIRNLEDSYGFSINVKSGKGSYIEGDEQTIRNSFYQLIEKNLDLSRILISQEYPLGYLEKILYDLVFADYITAVIEIIENMEQRYNRKLTHLSYKDFVIQLTIVMIRVFLGHTITVDEKFQDHIQKLESYEIACSITEEIGLRFGLLLTESEISSLVLLIEGAKYTSMENFKKQDWASLQVIANLLAIKVGERLEFDFINDEELIDFLILHLGPTMYKLRNRIPVVNPSLSVIKTNYHEVFVAIKESIRDIEYEDMKMMGEDDIGFLALHFCAALERRRRFETTFNVVIVCVHGVGTAALMKELICSRFKNIIVKRVITQGRLHDFDFTDIDFIISSIDLDIQHVPVVKVNAILHENDYKRIETALEEIGQSDQRKNSSFIEDLVSVVEKNVEVIDSSQLENDLINYFSESGLLPPYKTQLTLEHYLSENKVLVVEEVLDYPEAIRRAGQLLVRTGDIDKEYITSMIQTVEEAGDYMVIEKGIALVHGEIGRGINNVAMSMIVSVPGVDFRSDRNNPVHIILCLAAKDNYTHVLALNNFLRFIEKYRERDIQYYFEKKNVMKEISEVSIYD